MTLEVKSMAISEFAKIRLALLYIQST